MRKKTLIATGLLAMVGTSIVLIDPQVNHMSLTVVLFVSIAAYLKYIYTLKNTL